VEAERVTGERVSRGVAGTTAVCRVALLGMILVLIVIAYFPFAWSPPHTVRNQVTRSADGSLRFGEMNNARTPGTPAWLQHVRTSGTIQIQLQAYPQSLQQDASIMMLASDYWHTDFALTQDQGDLVVYLRRPGSDGNGDPPFVIGRILRPKQWTDVNVMLRQGYVRIDVDGRTRLTEHLPADSTRGWGQGQIALGDEVRGGIPWQGQIRLAQVSTSGYTVDYVRPGRLTIPQSYLYHPDHFEPFPSMNRGEWLDAFLHMLSFIPLGFLIVLARRPPVRPVPATLLAAALAVVLAAGKLLFDGRHASVVDIVSQASGGLLGALLASRLAHGKHGDALLRGHRHPHAAVGSGTREHRHA
jgi:VanZ family protein